MNENYSKPCTNIVKKNSTTRITTEDSENLSDQENRRKTTIREKKDSIPVEKAAIPSELAFSIIEEFASDFAILNLQGKVVFASTKFQARFLPEKVLNHSILEFIPLKYQPDILSAFKSEITTKKSINIRFIAGNQKESKDTFYIKKITDNREMSYIFLSIANINAEHQSYDELVRLRAILDQSPISLIITNYNGIVEYVNPYFERVTGYLKNEIIGKRPNILKSGELPVKHYADLWKTIKAGKTWKGEFHNKRKNGDLFWEMATITPLLDEEDVITHFVAIKEDITVRKLIFERLAQSEEHIRFIVEATGDVLYQYNYADDLYEYMNSAIVDLTGYSVQEINTLKLSGIIKEQDLASADIAATNVTDTKVYGEQGDYRAEYLIKTKAGSLKWIEDHSFPWFDDQKYLKGSVGILSDITHRKKIEIELMRAKEEAESMNRLKDVFLANMSHELRTPMISILGYSEILDDLTQNEEEKEIASIIHQSAVRLTDTINKLLDLSSLEAGGYELDLIDTDIGEISQGICAGYIANHQKQKVEIVNEITCNTYFVKADSRLLKQVIDNVINNALKYTLEGSVKLSISVKDSQVIMAIADTGIGIKKEDFKIIFQEFRQVSEGLNRKFEGSGLGLNISRRFLEKMNGKIWVESEIGNGSTFYISLKSAI